MSKLSPIIKGGTVTAGNSRQQNDAAAACLIVAEDRLRDLNVEPMAFLVGWAASGCEPAKMGNGPVPAVAKLLAKISLSLHQMDLIEINEAFACQVLSVLNVWRSRMKISSTSTVREFRSAIRLARLVCGS
jgi:acetyl-CoA C-acetyltransferase